MLFPSKRGAGARPCRRPDRFALEQLEAREVPALLVGLTTGNQLVTFDSDNPTALVGNAVTVTDQGGVVPLADTLVGIDYRPANGTLFALGQGGQLYTLAYSPGGTTAAATAIGSGTNPAPNGTNFGFDFNPVVDRIRITSDAEQNLRVNPGTGGVNNNTADTSLAYDANDPQNLGFFDTDADLDGDPATNPPTPPTAAQSAITAVAYTQDSDAGTGTTTLYGIDTANDSTTGADILVQIGSPDGTPNNPNGGQVVAVAEIRDANGDPVDVGAQNGFDIEPVTGMGYFVTSAGGNTTLYSLGVATGTATALGTVGNGLTLTGLAIAPPAAGNSTIQLSGNAFTFPADRGPLAITVTRTGGLAGMATVDYATADGTAVGGRDYLPNSGTITFNPGEASRTIFLSLPSTATPAPAPERTFTLTLANATGAGVILGTGPGTGTQNGTAATITIPAVVASTTPNRFFAIAAGAGGDGRVFVYDAISRTQAFTVSPFGTGFTLGMTVAVGDVNRDGFDDIVVGSGSGGGPRAVVIDGRTQAVVANFFAYDATFRGGVNVAVGDVDGDGFADVILGAGDGGGPQVRVVDGETLTDTTQADLANFFAYDPAFRGGVNVASGEFTGDSFADIVTGAGNTGGPVVRIFDGVTKAAVATYFAYDGAFRGGVYVAVGDVDGVGGPDVVTGTGPGGGPNVHVYRGTTFTPTASFFAFSNTLNGGVRVATQDLDANGTADILAAAGRGGPSTVRVFDATGASNGADLAPLDATFAGGVFVG